MQKQIYFIVVSFVIFAFALCIHPLYVTNETRIFSHVEEKDYGPTSIPRVLKTRVYDDDTVVARIVRKNTTTITSACFYEILSLRIIHPGGSVDEKDFKLDIPSFNYCFFRQQNERIGFLDYLRWNLRLTWHVQKAS